MDPLSRETKKLYRMIRSEFLAIKFRWEVFRLFYDGDDETISVLETVAATFFRVHYLDLLDAIVLAFGRLIDPAENYGNRNASLEQLITSLPKGYGHLELKLRLQHCEIRNCCQGIRDWRNKWAAHRDYDIALSIRPGKQLGFNRCDVAKALCHLRRFLRLFEKSFPEPAFHPDLSLSPDEQRLRQEEYDRYKVIDSASEGTYCFHGDGNALLELLRKAPLPNP